MIRRSGREMTLSFPPFTTAVIWLLAINTTVFLVLTAFGTRTTINWVFSNLGLVPMAPALALAAVAFTMSLREKRARRFWFLTNPVTVSLALIVRPWLSWDILDDFLMKWRVIGSASGPILVVALSWLCERIARRAKIPGERGFSVRWIAYAAVGLGLFSIAAGFGIRSRPRLIASGGASQAAGKPNVILIVLDTVRADHLSVYGYQRDTTPNMRRFAAESTLYRNAISAANWTAPSHASIFTGMYTLRHGVRYDLPDNRLGRLAGATPTLAETLVGSNTGAPHLR